MSNKHETIADIIAEMRGPYYKMGRSNATLDKDMMGYMSFMANRIEAAAKREREAGAEAEQICGEIGEMIVREATREKPSRVGNAAEMREALEELRDIVHNAFWSKDGTVNGDVLNALRRANVALVSPPRNCDLFATSKEAGEAFISQACENPCGNCTVSDEYYNPLVHECGIEWLFAEAKGVTDGSK